MSSSNFAVVGISGNLQKIIIILFGIIIAIILVLVLWRISLTLDARKKKKKATN